MVSQIYQPNEDVFIEGTIGNCMYIVDTGSYSVYKNTSSNSKGPKNQVFNYSTAGAVFGQLAVIYNTPRGMTITASSDKNIVHQCYKIDKLGFRAILMEIHENNENNEDNEALLNYIAVILSS